MQSGVGCSDRLTRPPGDDPVGPHQHRSAVANAICEAAGLVRRQPSASDRRIKLVTLTAKGAATKRALLRTYRTPPPELRGLSRAELERLVVLFTRLAAARR